MLECNLGKLLFYLLINKKMKKGFTFIELLIVIVIIAILVAILIVVVSPGENLAEARNTVRLSHLHTLESEIYFYVDNEGDYPFGITSTPTEICNTNLEIANCAGLVDLSILGIPNIPVDPQGGISEIADGTGYLVSKDPTLVLEAPKAELEETIIVGNSS